MASEISAETIGARIRFTIRNAGIDIIDCLKTNNDTPASRQPPQNQAKDCAKLLSASGVVLFLEGQSNGILPRTLILNSNRIEG